MIDNLSAVSCCLQHYVMRHFSGHRVLAQTMMRKYLFASFIEFIYLTFRASLILCQFWFPSPVLFFSQRAFISGKMAYVWKLTTIEKIQHILLNTNVLYWLFWNKTNNLIVERWMTGKWRHCRWWDWNDWTEREYIGRVWRRRCMYTHSTPCTDTDKR